MTQIFLDFHISDSLIARAMEPLVAKALADTRVVFVMGARQVGKSTLVSRVAAKDHPAGVFTLDDQVTLARCSR